MGGKGVYNGASQRQGRPDLIGLGTAICPLSFLVYPGRRFTIIGESSEVKQTLSWNSLQGGPCGRMVGLTDL